MTTRHCYPEFDRARTNVADGLTALREDGVADTDNLDHFATEARAALADLPDELPYVEDVRTALDKQHFAAALKALANLAAYVRESDEDAYTIQYPSEALDRIEEEARQFDL